MDFNPDEDPRKGYEKWRGEYYRYEGARDSSKKTWDAQKLALKYAEYFAKKLKGENPKPPQEGGKIDWSKYDLPEKKKKAPDWPGWDKVLDKL